MLVTDLVSSNNSVKGIDPILLQNQTMEITTEKPKECNCSKELVTTALDLPKKAVSSTKKHATGENILKLSIVLALGTAVYLYFSK